MKTEVKDMQTLGKYKIISKLGQGGFATVYCALDTTLQREVALKVLDPILFRDPSFIKRFELEARTAANVEHPNLVPIYEIAQAEGRYYIAMKYVSGGSLADQLQAGQPLPPPQTIRVVKGVAAALDYIHGRGLVHRDVKSSNILIDEDGQPRLSDFGLVRATEGTRLSTTGLSLGTPAYMSPEQAEGETAGKQSDIYALGVVLYEMLTGRLPFSADTPAAILYQHVHKAPPSPRDLQPKLPPAIEKVTLRALEKNPAYRYPSAGSLVQDLGRAVQGKPLAPVQKPTVARVAPATASKSKSKRSFIGVALAFLLLLCGLTVAGGFWAQRQGWLEGALLVPTNTISAEVDLGPEGIVSDITAAPTHTVTSTRIALLDTSTLTTEPSPTLTATSEPTATPTSTPSPTATPTSETAAGEVGPAYTVQIVAGSTEEDKGKLVVQIARGDGAPVTSQRVYVYRQKLDISDNWVTDGYITDRSTDNAGNVEFSLASGDYIVRADLRGYNWGNSKELRGVTSVPVQVGQVTQMRIDMGQLVVGFRYGDGQPVTNQRVYVYQQKLDVTGNWVVDGYATDAETDNGGTVTFNLTPGHYIVRSDFTGYNWGDAYDVQGIANFAVPPGEVTSLIRDLGQLVIGLTDDNGVPLTDERVYVYRQGTDLNNNPITAGSSIRSGRTDNGGVIRFNLTPGTYVIRVGDAYTYNVPLESGKLTLWDGNVATLQEP